MNKSKMIKELARRIYGNVTPNNIAICTSFMDTLQQIMEETWEDGDKITWENFFVAKVVEHKEHRGRHPITNEVQMFPAHKALRFIMHPTIKGLLNGEGGVNDY